MCTQVQMRGQNEGAQTTVYSENGIRTIKTYGPNSSLLDAGTSRATRAGDTKMATVAALYRT